MKCSTQCIVDGWENLGTTMSGNSESSVSYCYVEMRCGCPGMAQTDRKIGFCIHHVNTEGVSLQKISPQQRTRQVSNEEIPLIMARGKM